MGLSSDPLAFNVEQIVDTLASAVAARNSWSLDAVVTTPSGFSTDVSILSDGYTGGLIRIDVQIRAGWVTRRQASSALPHAPVTS